MCVDNVREPQFHCKWAATVDCFAAHTGNRIRLCNSRAGRGAAFNQLGKKIKLLDGERSRSAARSFSFIFEKGARDKRGTEERNKIKRVRRAQCEPHAGWGLWKLDAPRSKMNLSTPKPVLPKYPVLWTLVISFMKCTSDRVRVCVHVCAIEACISYCNGSRSYETSSNGNHRFGSLRSIRCRDRLR